LYIYFFPKDFQKREKPLLPKHYSVTVTLLKSLLPYMLTIFTILQPNNGSIVCNPIRRSYWTNPLIKERCTVLSLFILFPKLNKEFNITLFPFWSYLYFFNRKEKERNILPILFSILRSKSPYHICSHILINRFVTQRSYHHSFPDSYIRALYEWPIPAPS
jgi:hypothetical protein